MLAVWLPLAALAAPYAALVMDARTGEVLYETNADTRLHPASLTKMMTLYVAFEAIERGEITLDTKVTVSRHAASQPPSRLGLKPGQKIALRYLIRAAAIKSGNDAAAAIGEAISGSESAFAQRMTRTAKAIGMTRTTFRNAHGLTAEGHLSTARDMTILGRRLFYDYPQYYNIFSRRTADAGIAQVASTNRRFLDSYEGADGIKTGFTNAAGFNLTASAHRGSKRIIATVLGGKSTAHRNAKMAELLDIGFGKAPNKATVKKPAAPVYMAEAEAPEVVAPGSASETLAKGKTIRLIVAVTTIPRPRPRPAPVAEPPAEMLIAMQESIDSVLAEVQGTGAAPAPAPEAVAEAVQVAAAEPEAEAVPEGPQLVQSTEPQPETLALAAPPPAPRAEDAAEAVAVAEAAVEPEPAQEAQPVELALAAIGPPPPAPRRAPEAASPPEGPQLAQETAPQPETLALAAAEGPELVQETPAQPETLALAAVATAPEPAEGPELVQTTPAQPETLALAAAALTPLAGGLPEERPAGMPQPRARPEQIILASVDAAAVEEIDPAHLEVVTRVSSSGGRHHGINVGNFSSRYNAERMLLQTALAEMNTLDGALRKVVQRKGGFDANFVGLSQETAELACRRLQARNTECTVIGP